jgi:hypothetical protein
MAATTGSDRTGAVQSISGKAPTRPSCGKSAGDNCTLGLTALAVVVVLLSRLPLLGHGYGSDPDAWRAISAAQHLTDTGTYLPSRVPGYPLPEYVDAIMLYLGVGSSLGIGLISALLSGASAALFFHLLLPLGRTRAVAGTLAMSFTPVVYIAGLGAMDYMWGLTFFLAATSCMLSRRVWWAAIFLGLAAASRPSYALAILPVGLLYVDYDLRQLRNPVVWRQLAALVLCSGLIALAFFLPAFLNVGVQTPKVYGNWEYLAYNGSLGLFGIAGFAGVACAVVSAWINKRRGIPLPDPLGRKLNGWALTVLVLYGLLFVRLPDEASYLMPALLGLYWLLCRYARHIMLWVLTTLLLASCFFFSLDRRQGIMSFNMSGPVIREIDTQNERSCVAAVVKHKLAASPDGFDYVIAGAYRPQLLVEVGAPLSERILYTVRPDSGGKLVDTEGVPIPNNARLLLLDRVTNQQSEVWPIPEGRASVLDSYKDCAGQS